MPKRRKPKPKVLYEVSIPVCVYEVFFVEATSKLEALRKVRECDAGVWQNCTDVNAKWSRRILIRIRHEPV